MTTKQLYNYLKVDIQMKGDRSIKYKGKKIVALEIDEKGNLHFNKNIKADDDKNQLSIINEGDQDTPSDKDSKASSK
jgi:hypothetical protein